jgi:hypothetical protein
MHSNEQPQFVVHNIILHSYPQLIYMIFISKCVRSFHQDLLITLGIITKESQTFQMSGCQHPGTVGRLHGLACCKSLIGIQNI